MIVWDRASMKRLDKQIQQSTEQTAKELRDEILEAKVIPRDSGALQESFYIESSNSGSIRLVFDVPYAIRLYFHPEYKFKTDKNPNAQGEWMRNWTKGGRYQNRAAEICGKILERIT